MHTRARMNHRKRRVRTTMLRQNRPYASDLRYDTENPASDARSPPIHATPHIIGGTPCAEPTANVRMREARQSLLDIHIDVPVAYRYVVVHFTKIARNALRDRHGTVPTARAPYGNRQIRFRLALVVRDQKL